jgi:hypothetical protein
MAGRVEDTLLIQGKKRTVISLKFFPNGTSNPAALVAQESRGVASVIRNAAAGVFLITLSDTWRKLISATATVQHTTAVDLVPQFGDVANFNTSTAPTLVLRLNAGATPTDMTANANSSVSVQLIVSDSDAY